MKRSEICKQLEFAILDNVDAFIDEYGEPYIYVDQIGASRILERLEALGLLPPAKQTEPTYHENGKQLMTKIVNKWDEE